MNSRPSRSPADARNRAQSETIGTVLLIGVVVVAVGTFGAFFLSGFVGESAPLASISVDGNETTMNISHSGGERIATEDLRITVSQPGNSKAYTFENNGTQVRVSDPDTEFKPGDRWRFDTEGQGLEADQRVTVRLIHLPSNEVVDTGRYTFEES